MSHNNSETVPGLTADEKLVLEKLRKAKTFGSARVFITLDRGKITNLDVTEKETPGNLAAIQGKLTD